LAIILPVLPTEKAVLIFSFRRRNDYKNSWKISACFNVSNKDLVILSLFKKYLECGTLRSRPDNVWYYEVNSFKDLIDKVIPFFKTYGFLSDKKRNDFAIFCEILDILLGEQPRSEENIRIILNLRNQMNHGGKRKFKDEEILAVFQTKTKESSETIRQTQLTVEMI
jgi:LAGLIDADG DNA endonuclease family protein